MEYSAICGWRPKGAALWNPATFWKRWTKTLLTKTRGRVRRRKGKPNGRECQRGLPRLKKAGENFACEAPRAGGCAAPQRKEEANAS